RPPRSWRYDESHADQPRQHIFAATQWCTHRGSLAAHGIGGDLDRLSGRAARARCTDVSEIRVGRVEAHQRIIGSMLLHHIDLASALRRLAEKRIEEAMKEGKFDNLAGAGKPLNLEPMPADEGAR